MDDNREDVNGSMVVLKNTVKSYKPTGKNIAVHLLHRKVEM